MGFKTQTIPDVPDSFDGAKFCARHSIVMVDGEAPLVFLSGRVLHYPDSLPDDAADPGGLDAPG
jgi:hypothetical protein